MRWLKCVQPKNYVTDTAASVFAHKINKLFRIVQLWHSINTSDTYKANTEQSECILCNHINKMIIIDNNKKIITEV